MKSRRIKSMQLAVGEAVYNGVDDVMETYIVYDHRSSLREGSRPSTFGSVRIRCRQTTGVEFDGQENAESLNYRGLVPA